MVMISVSLVLSLGLARERPSGRSFDARAPYWQQCAHPRVAQKQSGPSEQAEVGPEQKMRENGTAHPQMGGHCSAKQTGQQHRSQKGGAWNGIQNRNR